MADEKKPKTYEEMREEARRQEKERIDRMAKNEAETREWLRTNPAIQEYFNQFSSYSVKEFIEKYASVKALYLEYGSHSAHRMEETNSEYFEIAYKCLYLIQQKKLFDLFKQWDAELITLPGILCSMDFYPHSRNTLNCKLITPISPADFELFMQFTREPDFDIPEDIEWMEITEADKYTGTEEPQLNEWFNFHNIHTGANRYMALPGIRQKKEERYRQLFFEEKSAEMERKYQTGELQRPVTDNRPQLLSYSYESMLEFVERFETDANKRKFKDQEQYSPTLISDNDDENAFFNEWVEDHIYELTRIKPVLPIAAHEDWRKALYIMYALYQRRQFLEMLPLAYEDYRARLETGIAFEFPENLRYHDSLPEMVRNQILRGRELAGEPRDWNF